MGIKLTIYMIEGTEYGPRIAEIGNWVGKGIYSNRASIHKIIGRPEFNKPGVYCLKSSPQDEIYSERIYIGEAENIGIRLKQHLAKEDSDFEEIIFFISKDAWLTKTQIKYLECRLIQIANEAKSAEIVNGNNPNLPTLHEADISDMEYFLDRIKLILPLMGFRFLIPTIIKEQFKNNQARSREIYKIKTSSFNAQMYEDEQGFIVLKGSQANKSVTPSLSKTYRTLREKLINSRILVDKGEYMEFMEDTIFSSPSAASNMVLGRQSAGPIEWINSENKTYKEVTEQ